MELSPEEKQLYSKLGKLSVTKRGLKNMTKEERSEYMKRVRRGEKQG